MSTAGTARRHPAVDAAVPADAFQAGLAAALPAEGFWGMPVLVACSGGADSVALLLGLHRVAPRDALGRLVVVHAEHDLRPEAPADRAFVQRLAARLDLRCLWRRLAVRTAGVGGDGVEARARRLRYEFLADAARETGARHVVVAHTADDQAETILQRMLRGTGLAGLGGMQPARPLCDGVSLLRPLLGLRRGVVREFLVAAGQAWCEDASNADRAFARNFLRHDVLGPCMAGPFPAAVAALGRLGRQAALVAGALQSAAGHLLDAHASRLVDGTILLRTAPLECLDRLLLAEVFATLWNREGWPRRDMTARHYAALAGMTAGDDAAQDFPGGVRARRRAVEGTLTLTGPGTVAT